MRNSLKRLVRRTRESVLRAFGRWERLDRKSAWIDNYYNFLSAHVDFLEGLDRPYRLRIKHNRSLKQTMYFASLTVARVMAADIVRTTRLKEHGRWNTARILAVRAEAARIEERRLLNRES